MPEKTEDPTPRRREEFRQKGQVARSMELAPSLSLLAITAVLSSYGATLVAELAQVMSRSLGQSLITQDWTVGTVYQGGLSLMLTLTRLIAPILLVALAVGVATNVGQTRFLFTFHSLAPNLDRLNPIQGLGRVFSRRGLVELVKSLAKMLIIGFVVYRSLAGNLDVLAAAVDMELPAAAAALARVGMSMVLRVALLMAVLAGLDYVFQRRQFERDIRMTKHEVQEELQNIEGHPLIKSRRQRAQQQLALQRMMQDVPTADVVVTNPTHLAVALGYKAEEMDAPTVVAKGQRYIAERIVELAREHSVPVVQNIPLARALYEMAEVGQEVPMELYQAVAEVLAFVYQLRARK
ncbi:MAG: Flagellar biosynthetic protein FlhB [Anaerolineales bacterium]|nr:Flagellar biosynthetic protein FlhB [Anaerolineales bacterium]